MWGNDSFGSSARGGGGFVPSDGRSPATGDKQQSRVKRSQNIFPMTVRQLLESQEENIRIHDIEVSVVTIVGLVKSVEHSSTKTTYVIDDMTGSIEAVTYVGTDEGDSKAVTLREGTYGRVSGNLRTTKGTSGSNSKYVITFKVSPVLDMNELTSHGLEVLQVPIKLKKLKEQQTQRTGLNSSANAGTSLSNSMIGNDLGNTSMGANVSAESSLNGLNPHQAMVFRCIQSVKTEEGAHVQQIIANLKNKVSEKDVRSAVEFLSGEGHVYSTTDDEHYKCTDW